MNLGSLAGGVCRVCGSDTLGADIGCSCIIMYERATYIALRNHEEESLAYNWYLESEIIMDKFCSMYEDSLEQHKGKIENMYRSEFNRSFFPSVYAQWKEKRRVSKKQRDIVWNKYFIYDFYLRKEVEDKVKAAKKSFISAFKGTYDSEIIEIARNLWKQKKANKETK